MTRAIERVRRQIAEMEAQGTEALVSDATLDLPEMRRIQGMIMGFRAAGEMIDDMRRRYDQEDGDDDTNQAD